MSEVADSMATGRIRRKARRGLAVAVLGWLCAAVAAVLLAPSASAASSVTVEIKNVTPPAASVEPGGTVTFVNKIPAQNKGGISVPLVGSVTATVYTDVSVTFFGQKRDLQFDKSAAWTFTAPATTGTIEYKYRIVPQAGLTASVANQVINTVAAGLPKLPVPTPYVVQTVAPAVPNLPSVNLPELPQVSVDLPEVLPTPDAGPAPVPNTGPTGPTQGGPPQPPQGISGSPYEYGVGAPPQVVPVGPGAAAAFDASRFFVAAGGEGGSGGSGSGVGSGSGSGGLPGSYDGASVPVFGQLAGLDSASLDQQAADEAATGRGAGQTLPAAALVAVVALAAVTAALVRTHLAARSSR
jgi:hypothetical protein